MKLKRIIASTLIALLVFPPAAFSGPFIPGQVLTAAQLNSVVDSKCTNAACAITGGTITGATIDSAVIGGTTPAAGTFSTLATKNISTGVFPNYGLVLNWASTVAATNAGMACASSRGTLAAPSATQANDVLCNSDVWGYTGSAWGYGASISTTATTNWAVGNTPTTLAFNVTPQGSATPATALSISASGVVATTGINHAGQFTQTFADGQVTDYVTGNGRISVGAVDTLSVYNGGVGSNMLAQFGTGTGTINQYGVYTTLTGTSTATSSIVGIASTPGTAAAAFTSNSVIGFIAGTVNKGAGSTITNAYGFYAADQTQGVSDYGFYSAVTAGANKYAFYNAGGAAVNFGSGAVSLVNLANNVTNSVIFNGTAPTISSGFGTTPSVVSANGTAAFNINVGTGGTASSGVVAMPQAATTGWNCTVMPTAAPQAGAIMYSAPTSTTSITITNYTLSTGAALAWPASTVIAVKCIGY